MVLFKSLSKRRMTVPPFSENPMVFVPFCIFILIYAPYPFITLQNFLAFVALDKFYPFGFSPKLCYIIHSFKLSKQVMRCFSQSILSSISTLSIRFSKLSILIMFPRYFYCYIYVSILFPFFLKQR